jgi:hypothetical protein
MVRLCCKQQNQKQMKTTLMQITPEDAARIMEKNTANRPLNMKHVKRLAREIELDRWKVNGATICLNGERLIDGQHRLAAVMMAGKSIETLVVEGLDSAVFATIDAGKIRSAGDTLALLGVAHANLVAAAVKVVDLISTGRGRQIGSVIYTNAEMEELYERHPQIADSARLASKQKLCLPSVIAGLHYLFALRDPEAADKYVHDVTTGANLSDHDGVYLFRERLMQNSYMRNKLRGDYLAALGIKAWNARRSDRRIAMLRYLETEDFPLIAD